MGGTFLQSWRKKWESWADQGPISAKQYCRRLLVRRHEKTNAMFKLCVVFIPTMHRFLFVTEWHAMEIERILSRPISTVFERESLVVHSFGGFPRYPLATNENGRQVRITTNGKVMPVGFRTCPWQNQIKLCLFDLCDFVRVHARPNFN